MQYIGRLMRHVESEPIRAALSDARGDSVAGTARLHRTERLRDALLEDEAALSEIAALHPGIDLQRLRTLRRAALKEKESGKPPRSYRAIFQMLKDADLDVGEQTGDA
jgi:ribosome-associated protein